MSDTTSGRAKAPSLQRKGPQPAKDFDRDPIEVAAAPPLDQLAARAPESSPEILPPREAAPTEPAPTESATVVPTLVTPNSLLDGARETQAWKPPATTGQKPRPRRQQEVVVQLASRVTEATRAQLDFIATRDGITLRQAIEKAIAAEANKLEPR
jgi:hypothetical protein